MSDRNYSYLTPKCERRRLSDNVYGVFATAAIAKEELVCLWAGRIMNGSELKAISDRFTQSVLQVDEDLYMVTVGTGIHDV